MIIKPYNYKFTVNPQFESLMPFIKSLPDRWFDCEGETIYFGRNELRRFTHDSYDLVVKGFGKPNIINRFVYGNLRRFKGQRAYDYAMAYTRAGIPTPAPVACINCRYVPRELYEDYYISLESHCRHTYADLFLPENAEAISPVMKAVAEVTARIHSAGFRHLDYGRGNILWSLRPDGSAEIDIVDVNRQKLGAVSLHAACRNLERLPMTPRMRHLFAETYAPLRGYDPAEVERLMEHYRASQPGKIDNMY